MNAPYLDLEIIQLPLNDIAANLDNEFILIDNFDGTDPRAAAGFVNYPVKLSFSIVIFCLAGTMSFRINLQDFTLHPGDILVVQKGAIGEFLYRSQDNRVAIMAYTNDYFQLTQHLEASISLQRLLYENPLCHMCPEVIEECMTIYRLMKTKIRETGNPFRKGALMGYVQVLMYNAYNYLLATIRLDDRSSPKRTRKQDLYNKFMEEVQKGYMRERSITYYANILCITPKYLSQIVQQVSGRLAGDWIADYVILEAKALLKSRKYTIQQVSDMLNFPNQSFFGRYFKEKVGCSPSAYQNTP